MKNTVCIFIIYLILCSCSTNNTAEIQAKKCFYFVPLKDSSHIDRHLVDMLNSIFNLDQNVRNEYDHLFKKYGESKEIQVCLKKMHDIDSVNTISVTKIIDQFGWLGTDVVGNRGNETLFLVIQHADLKIQEKYLPIMRQAVIDGKAPPNALALLEDRVLISHGKKQIYGSQIQFDSKTKKYYILPIENEPNVNKRRECVGLEPLEEYIKTWDIKYIPPTK